MIRRIISGILLLISLSLGYTIIAGLFMDLSMARQAIEEAEFSGAADIDWSHYRSLASTIGQRVMTLAPIPFVLSAINTKVAKSFLGKLVSGAIAVIMILAFIAGIVVSNLDLVSMYVK